MLHLITGDKKSGKTEFILNKMRGKKDCTLIVPEQTLFKYETLILDKLGEENAFLINTLSFKKLAMFLVRDDESYNKMKLMDNDTRRLVLERILLEKKDELKVFSKSVKKPEFADKIAAQITEFKRYLLTPLEITDITKNPSLSGGLKDKLSDIGIIYREYENYMGNIFKDADGIITFAADKIEKEKLYFEKTVLIDGFTGFTKDELYMIESILLCGADVYITLPYEENKALNSGDLYYSVSKTLQKLSVLAKRTGLKSEIIKLNECFISADGIRFLKDSFGEDLKAEKTYDDITVTECRNVYSECLNLTSDIICNIKNNTTNLSKIAVILPDVNEYMRYLEGILKEFDIPYYCNEKISVYDLSVAMLLCNLFDLILSSNRQDILLCYLKSGYFFKESPDKIYRFENFIKQTGVKVYSLFSKPFNEIIEEKKKFNFEIENEEELTEVYERVIHPVKVLKEKLSKEKDARGYSLCLYEFFGTIQLWDVISKFADDYEKDGDIIKASQLIQVYNYIVESMERASIILSDCEIDFRIYKDIIISGLKNKNIASIPLLNDSIMISDLQGFCDNSFDYVYILGAIEGKIPDTSFFEGIINEAERAELSEFGFEMSMSYELKMCENILKLYDALTSAEKKISISYPVYDKSGDENIKSSFVSDIIEMTGLKVLKENCEIISKRELLRDTLYSVSKKSEITNNLRYLMYDEEYGEFTKKAILNLGKSCVSPVKISTSKLDKLIGKNLNLSATNLEKYRSCAFSYFIKYVLKAKDKKEYSINYANIGSLLHSVLENFSLELKKDKMSFCDIDDSYISKKLDRIVKKAVSSVDNGIFSTDIKSDFLVKKAKRISAYTLNLIKLHFTKGLFEPMGFEMSFGRKDSLINPLSFELENGRKILINGVIDRVDKLSAEDGEYIRIVDYKSTGKTVDFYEIFSGMKIQLATYLITVLKNEDVNKIKPGGMLYLTLDSPIISVKNPLDTEDIELKIRKNHIMTGIFLNNDKVLSAMDSELINNSASEIIDVKFDKNGLLNGKNTLTADEFEYMLSSVVSTVKNEGENIFKGKFSINPVMSGGKTQCTYCPYGAICMFEEGTCSYDVISKISKEEIFKEMGGEENE